MTRNLIRPALIAVAIAGATSSATIGIAGFAYAAPKRAPHLTEQYRHGVCDALWAAGTKGRILVTATSEDDTRAPATFRCQGDVTSSADVVNVTVPISEIF